MWLKLVLPSQHRCDITLSRWEIHIEWLKCQSQREVSETKIGEPRSWVELPTYVAGLSSCLFVSWKATWSSRVRVPSIVDQTLSIWAGTTDSYNGMTINLVGEFGALNMKVTHSCEPGVGNLVHIPSFTSISMLEFQRLINGLVIELVRFYKVCSNV